MNVYFLKKDNWPFGPYIASCQLVLTTGDIPQKVIYKGDFLLFPFVCFSDYCTGHEKLELEICYHCEDVVQIRTSKLAVCHVTSLRVMLQTLDHAPRQRRRPGPNVWIFCLEECWSWFQPWFQPWFGFVHFFVSFSPIAGERTLDKHICHVGWNHCLETNDRAHADWDYFIPRRDCLVAWFKFSLVTARWSGCDHTPP